VSPSSNATWLRHQPNVAVGYEDPDLIPGRQSWWEAEPVRLARTLVRTGRVAGLQGPGRIQRDDAAVTVCKSLADVNNRT
jgi:hypothetical protein